MKSNRKPIRSGFTLIELLVVIAILGVVGIVVIPSVRTLNEDRKVRDTARIVGAFLAAARERAAVDGMAGVEIQSVANAQLRYNLPNMGLILYQLRAIPPYLGDTFESEATAAGAVITFTDADLLAAEVQIGDFIELNGSGVPIEIIAVDAMEVTVVNPNVNPPMPGGAVPYRINRQPVRIESSAVRLPNNLFLNMALSGYGTASTITAPAENEFDGRQFRDFESTPPTGHPDAPNYPTHQAPGNKGPEGSTQIWFAKDGSVKRVTTRRYVPAGLGTLPETYDDSSMEAPDGPISLLMCNNNNDDVDITNLDSPAFLEDKNNMWITIDNRNGSVSIDRQAQINPVFDAMTNTLRTQIQDARKLARGKRSNNP